MTTNPPRIDRVTDKYAWVQYPDYQTGDYLSAPRKEKRFLCVNGPLEGERRSWSELVVEKQTRRGRMMGSPAREGYCQYNNGGSGPESMVYVWFGV